jgi:hypothetical protein
MERNLVIHSVVFNVEPLKEPARHDRNRTSSEIFCEVLLIHCLCSWRGLGLVGSHDD